MSFVDLMASHVWSEADIVRRTEALAHAELTTEEEAILSRKVVSAMLGKWEMSASDLTTQAKFVAACVAAHQAGVDARADMHLLQSVLDVEAAQHRLLLPEVADSDQDVAERNAAQAVINAVAAPALALVQLRNPPKENHGKTI
jgi:hypothetical protein